MATANRPHVVFLIRDISLAGEPHGIMQLAAIAKQRGWDFSVATLVEDYVAVLKTLRPQLIAASVMSSDINAFSPALEKIKREHPETSLIAGGPHPTFVPDSIGSLCVDAVVVGEGEKAFSVILDRVSNGNGFDGIDNVARKGKPYTLGPLVEDLDSLPDIERDFVYNHYNRLIGDFKLKSFFSSRGCPNRCTYCFNHAYNRLYRGKGKLLRKRSVDRIIEEVLRVKSSYPMRYIRFADDVFVLHADDWLDEFRRKFSKAVGIPFYCLVSANTVSEDMVKSLKEAGCRSACISIEFGREDIRRKVLGRPLTDEKITRAFDLFNKHGINMYTNSMVGIPETTIDDDFATLELAIRCGAKYSGFTIITPYPGTEFFEYVKGKNTLPEGKSIGELMTPSTGTRSVLNCFSEEQKDMQVKFIKLAPMTASFPFMKRFTRFAVKRLPDNKLFDLIFWFTKNYMFKKYIVPIKFSLLDYFRLMRRSFKEEMHHINKN